ncbi:putative NADPH-dependent FMN reductase [Pseudomassariella vexata]|uniref:Putative NADPH-dependent FMN reductase n=1 Tax=Pseudomassariella vexata TaxID=1141098 RepID=A0A1Y2EE01_9PEZI|nr:putative NADPH-dependent FMN reductase [Pseudomassariella vexata]ORY69637.1 putative NADPH-dependent FMN reductase [Pseudomassariella vexata]
MAESKTFKIGIIIGSTRVVRVGPQVAKFILDTVQTGGPSESSSADTTLKSRTTVDIIDIKDFNLPIFDEPGIPNRIKSPEAYQHEHTRVWGRHIASYDAFVFLSAQRNWGIPAELKNAIDYLFHEWKGKPAMIITFGGHGGLQCAEQLRTVIGAIGMRVVERMVNMKFPSFEYLDKGFKGEDLGLDVRNDEGPWAEHREAIAEVFWDEMVSKMLVVV